MSDILLTAVNEAFTLECLLFCMFGVLLGIVVGAIPGLTATMAIAILIPFTYNLEMIPSIAMLLGVYNGGVYGGSISAILMGVPGTPAASMTSLDGFPMARRGEGGKAIGIATVSSFIGGIIGCICLLILCSLLASVAKAFGYPEYFVLTVFALVIISNASGNIVKGLISAAFGVLVSIVGTDAMTGCARLNFGSTALLSGISLIPGLIGLFGVSELINQLYNLSDEPKPKQKVGKIFPGWKLLWEMKGPILRSAFTGTFIGALPGTGGTVGAFTAYNYEKSRSEDPASFGKGNPVGIAAPESANNAAVGGALIPMMALAVPGDGITAILMGAFVLHGVYCGPTIFTEAPSLVYSVYIFEIIANIVMVCLGLFFARWFSKVIDVDDRVLIPVILLICMIGAFSASNHIYQIIVMLVFGIIGFIFRKTGIDAGTAILGIVLGKMSEVKFRSAMAMSRGSLSVFFRPICLILWALAILMIVMPKVSAWLRKRKAEKKAAAGGM